jgi:hypothetical protein
MWIAISTAIPQIPSRTSPNPAIHFGNHRAMPAWSKWIKWKIHPTPENLPWSLRLAGCALFPVLSAAASRGSFTARHKFEDICWNIFSFDRNSPHCSSSFGVDRFNHWVAGMRNVLTPPFSKKVVPMQAVFALQYEYARISPVQCTFPLDLD